MPWERFGGDIEARHGVTAITTPDNIPLRQFRDHPRDWRENLYAYPVVSRRSGGLSIGVNLNPDTACNFDCVYCQVDRTGEPRVRKVDVARLGDELAGMIEEATSGRLFDDPAFCDVPTEMRTVKDIAFSGDGEPTTCPKFLECVQLAARLQVEAGLDDTKIALITDACYLARPQVVSALEVLDGANGEIWAKLDAGSEDYFRRVNRPNFPLQHVIDNIIAAARVRPVVIQSLFMRLDGVGPDEVELSAFVDRLTEITRAGGRIGYVQIYTIARRPAQDTVVALSDNEVDHIVRTVGERTGLCAEPFYGVM